MTDAQQRDTAVKLYNQSVEETGGYIDDWWVILPLLFANQILFCIWQSLCHQAVM